MITKNINIFIERFYKNNDLELLKKKSIIYICKKDKFDIKDIIKKNLSKNNWIGLIDKNLIYLKLIKIIKNNEVILSKSKLIFNWDEWKYIVNYKKLYNPGKLIKSKNPFPKLFK